MDLSIDWCGNDRKGVRDRVFALADDIYEGKAISLQTAAEVIDRATPQGRHQRFGAQRPLIAACGFGKVKRGVGVVCETLDRSRVAERQAKADGHAEAECDVSPGCAGNRGDDRIDAPPRYVRMYGREQQEELVAAKPDREVAFASVLAQQ